jgi:hypothetical protein
MAVTLLGELGKAPSCKALASSSQKWASPTPASKAAPSGQGGPLRTRGEALSLRFNRTIQALIVLTYGAMSPCEP